MTSRVHGMTFNGFVLPGMTLGCITWYDFYGFGAAWNDIRVHYLEWLLGFCVAWSDPRLHYLV